MNHNYAFVDGQNLHLGTIGAAEPWEVDLRRFRIYLREKYKVENAYYFLGFISNENEYLYQRIQEAGFILMFREHDSKMASHKKGNVDTEVVFEIMKNLYKNNDMDNVVLVSGDGDYCRMVNFLIKENRFTAILFPNRAGVSSLYRKLEPRYRVGLDSSGVKDKIKKEGSS